MKTWKNENVEVRNQLKNTQLKMGLALKNLRIVDNHVQIPFETTEISELKMTIGMLQLVDTLKTIIHMPKQQRDQIYEHAKEDLTIDENSIKVIESIANDFRTLNENGMEITKEYV